MTITKDIIELAKKIDDAQEWNLDDCKALCEAMDMGDEWEVADGETFEAVVEKAIATALVGACEKRHFPAEEDDPDAYQDLYSGIAPLYGGWILTTAGDPLTLEACEEDGDEATIAKVNALLRSDDWRVTMGSDDIYYVADRLKAWGIDF